MVRSALFNNKIFLFSIIHQVSIQTGTSQDKYSVLMLAQSALGRISSHLTESQCSQKLRDVLVLLQE